MICGSDQWTSVDVLMAKRTCVYRVQFLLLLACELLVLLVIDNWLIAETLSFLLDHHLVDKEFLENLL